MRTVIQRVTSAKVTVDNRQTGTIGEGLLVLLGVHKDDEQKDITWLADKIINLRIFDNENGNMNHSLKDTGGSMLIVSQFTLLADCRKGRRPSWSEAAPPDKARRMYEEFIQTIADSGITTATGEFQAMMDVELINQGPVTILLDSAKSF